MGNLTDAERAFVTEKLQEARRSITVETKKQLLGKLTYRIVLDKKAIGECVNGETFTFEIDGMPHEIFCISYFPNASMKALDQYSQIQEIPAGIESIGYYVYPAVSKSLVKGMRDKQEYLELMASESDLSNNLSSYQSCLGIWKFQCNIKQKIWNFAPEFKDSEGDIDVAIRFNNLFTEEEKKYDLVTDVARKFRDKNYVHALNNYHNFRIIFQALDTVEASGFFQDEVAILNKHRDKLTNEYEKRASIFTNCDNFGEALEQLKKEYMSLFGGMHIPKEVLDIYLKEFALGHPLRQEKKLFEALKKTLWVDFEWEKIEELKYLLIFDALLSEKSEKERQYSEGLRLIYTSLFGHVHDKNENFLERLTVDQIIILALIYQRGNMMDNINTQLAEALEVMIPLTEGGYNFSQDPSQFNVLQKAFEYFQAPTQEKMVLEAMFRYNVPRTPEQEQRLAFLNRGEGSTINIPDAAVKQGDKTLVFDYRTSKWGIKEIENYVDNFTFNSRSMDIPVVVESQEHNLNVSSVKWDEEDVMQFLQRCLFENFGERYDVQVIEAGAVLESGTDMLPAIFISEKNTFMKGYPYLGFVVMGEQLTMRQLNLSIYVLLLPGRIDHQEILLQKTNAEILNNIIMVKEKQNPRINNYISTVNNVLTSELQAWLNGQASTDIYA